MFLSRLDLKIVWKGYQRVQLASDERIEMIDLEILMYYHGIEVNQK